MLVFKLPILKLSTTVVVKQARSNIHVSFLLCSGKLWRQKVGLPKLQTARGPLTDLPDYSFVDGRPTPLSVGQVRRKELQEELTREILNGLNYLKRTKQIQEDLKTKL